MRPPFFRVLQVFFSTKEGGTGMGMSIVHNFVAMHDGDIEISTGPPGTLINVAIPTGVRTSSFRRS